MAIDPERVNSLFLAAIERIDPADRRAVLDAWVTKTVTRQTFCQVNG